VRPGERVLVLGWTGSGKTSLLKALAGLARPTLGRVLWNGEDVWGLSAKERRTRQAAFGMVFQADALFDSMNVLENVELPLLRRGTPPDEAKSRAREVLVQVGLAHAEATYPERLSGGMRKRAGLARALAARPQVLLADDPLSGLDPATGAEVTERISEAAEGRTLVWAAPEPPPSISFPRWIWLDEGRVLHDGPPRPALLEEEEARA
jgi:phospholipid/cholesterol/gamma-HCH transport system ATP-binding protein